MIYLFRFELCALIYIHLYIRIRFRWLSYFHSRLLLQSACLFCTIACYYYLLCSFFLSFSIIIFLYECFCFFFLFFSLCSSNKNQFICFIEHGCLILQFMCLKMCDKTVCSAVCSVQCIFSSDCFSMDYEYAYLVSALSLPHTDTRARSRKEIENKLKKITKQNEMRRDQTVW